MNKEKVSENLLQDLCLLFSLEEAFIIELSRKIINLAKDYHLIYADMKSLSRFTSICFSEK